MARERRRVGEDRDRTFRIGGVSAAATVVARAALEIPKTGSVGDIAHRQGQPCEQHRQPLTCAGPRPMTPAVTVHNDPVHSERMRLRAAIVSAIRHYFDDAGFLEVDTPVAISAPAPEVHIEAPAVSLRTGADAERTRYLQPSPELPMKRVLAQGFDRIYQIAAVFRDGELGPLHHPEFRMLEWYRRDATWEVLLDDCEGLLRTTAIAAHGEPRLRCRGETIDLSLQFRRVTMEEAFVAHAGFSILAALTTEALAAQLRRLSIRFDAGDSWNDLFHRVFLNCVEPELLRDSRPLFLTDYPAPLCALARLDPNDPRIAQRFEMYVGGIELANGFGELTDPIEQRRRFDGDRAQRRLLAMHDYPIDQRFLDALAALPPCAGIALGVDRLVALLLDVDSLDAVSFIPWGET